MPSRSKQNRIIRPRPRRNGLLGSLSLPRNARSCAGVPTHSKEGTKIPRKFSPLAIIFPMMELV